MNVKTKYNQMEKRYFCMFLFIVLCFVWAQVFVNLQVGKFDKGKVMMHKHLAFFTYVGVLIVHIISLLLVAAWLLHALRNHEKNNYLYHRRLIYFYTTFIMVSLMIKLVLAAMGNLFSYDVDWPFVSYTMSDLIILTLFCYFKRDEDCFYCFNRCDDIPYYSVFQIKTRRLTKIDDYEDFRSES